MSNHQQLDNIRHKNLKVITTQHPDYGENESYARLVLGELAHAQADYPLFFRKNSETGQFEIIAMFGFDKQENLFLDTQGWHAHYLPLSIQRKPFLIGLQPSVQSSDDHEHATVHIDMDSPRISEAEGESVFLEHGGQSPYLQHISQVLASLHAGHKQTPDFINALLSHELIEAVDLKVTLNDDSTHQLSGLYTIHEEHLNALDAQALSELHQKGYLKCIYMMIASVSNISRLIALKNKQMGL